jgi:fibronectin type 3 domain-containing protein
MRRLVCLSIVLGLMTLSVSISGCGGGGSTPSSTTTSPSPTPSPTPAPQAHSVAISWQPSASSGVISYNVYRSTVSGGPYARVGNVTSSSFTDNNVKAGTTYFYVVTSLNGSQVESAVSAEIRTVVPTP